jgi:hypothetical protein
MLNVEQLKIRMGIIAGRATGILPINKELRPCSRCARVG